VAERRPDSQPALSVGSEVMDELVSVLQGVHIPCWIVDDDGAFVWANDAFIEMFGDRRGDHYSVFIAPENLESAARHFERTHQDAVGEDDLKLMLPDGTRIRTEISTVYLDGIGLCCGAFGIAGGPLQLLPSANVALTPRQAEVLLLLSEGASTDQIASKLFVTPVTVRNHIGHILAQLDVHSRLAAVAKARTLGLISD